MSEKHVTAYDPKRGFRSFRLIPLNQAVDQHELTLEEKERASARRRYERSN